MESDTGTLFLLGKKLIEEIDILKLQVSMLLEFKELNCEYISKLIKENECRKSECDLLIIANRNILEMINDLQLRSMELSDEE
jgi:hypothetical protein